MRINPEIQRNFWLEFSLHRLIAMPLILGVIFFVVSRANPDNVPAAFVATADALFFIIVKMWGGYKAANSVIEEVNDRTWDFQKLSALSPWSLTVGKLLGSTSYAWYGGFILFVVFSMSIPYMSSIQDYAWHIALFLLAGFTVHAAALLTSLVGVSANEDGRRRKLRPVSFLLLGLIIGGIGQPFTAIAYLTRGAKAANQVMPSIHWYGGDYDHYAFLTFSITILLAWLVGGIYWHMRGQMKMKTGPWLWAAFLIFWGYFWSGFGYPSDATAVTKSSLFGDALSFSSSSSGALRAFLVSIVGLYFIAFNEPWTGVRYRRLADAWAAHNFGKCLEQCPRWLVTYIICVFFALGAPVPGSTDLIAPLTALFFAARDIAILHFFKLSPNNRRAMQATAFYLVMLYGLIPFLLGILHMKTALIYFVPAFFYPAVSAAGVNVDVSAGLIAGALQAALAIMLALNQWQKHWRKT